MTDLPYRTALIIGAGVGISASLARKLAKTGCKVGLAARNSAKLDALAGEIGGQAFAADATDPAAMAQLFEEADGRLGEPDVVIYNAAARARGPIAEIDPNEIKQTMAVCAFGAFLATQQAARRMIPKGRGAILFTGSSASVKGFELSTASAMGKFALRGLAQSAARELGPRGIHVAHVLVDGGIRSAARPERADRPDSMLDPDAIADAFLHLISQPRSAWTHELDLRPWAERF